MEKSDSKPSGRRWVSWALKGVIALVASVGALAWAVHGVDLGEVGGDWRRLGVVANLIRRRRCVARTAPATKG